MQVFRFFGTLLARFWNCIMTTWTERSAAPDVFWIEHDDSPVVIKSHLDADSTSTSDVSNPYGERGITFQNPNTTPVAIKRIAFRLGQDGSTQGSITVKLYEGDGSAVGSASPSGDPGTELYTATSISISDLPDAETLPSLPDLTWFSFESGAVLQGQTVYVVTFDTVEPADGDLTLYRDGDTGAYEGRSVLWDGNDWVELLGGDLNFSVEVINWAE